MQQVVFDTTLSRTIKTQSCDHCFIRKIKCNRLTPCSSCAATGALCTYERRRTSRKSSRLGSQRLSPRRAAAHGPDSEGQLTPHHNEPLYVACGGTTAGHSYASHHDEIQSRAAPQKGNDHGQGLAMSAQEHDMSAQLVTQAEDWVHVLPLDFSPPFLGTDSEAGDSGIFQESDFLWPDHYPPADCPIIPHEYTLTIPPSLAPLDFTPGLNPFLESPFVPLMADMFVNRLQPTMPFFKRDFLRHNVDRNRHISDPSFGSLVHAICSLTLFQAVQGEDKAVLANREMQAEGHLALALHLHSRASVSQKPTVEVVMTSIFLFACNFCKCDHRAAQMHLRQASAQAEVMELHRVDRYGHISPAEKDRRIRTYICLTIIERIYAIQREYPLYPNMLTGPRVTELREAIDSSPEGCGSEDLTAIEGLGNMLEQVDFIDADMVRCWKDSCWIECPGNHVTRATVLALLRRYQTLPRLADTTADTAAQHADILITRNWMRHKLWSLGYRHGYIAAINEEPEMKPSHALTIASDTITTCLKFELASLETHGVGLVEKLSNISTSALNVARDFIAGSVGANTPATASSSAGYASTAGSYQGCFAAIDHGDGLDAGSRVLLGNAEEMFNKYLALFATFRAGKHEFLRPYMRLLLSVDFPTRSE